MYPTKTVLQKRQLHDIQVIWKQHTIDPLPMLCAGERADNINLLQLIGQVDHIVEKFLETQQLGHVYLRALEGYQGQAQHVMKTMQGEKQEYFARLYWLCQMLIQYYD